MDKEVCVREVIVSNLTRRGAGFFVRHSKHSN